VDELGDLGFVVGGLYGICPFCQERFSDPYSVCATCSSALLRREWTERDQQALVLEAQERNSPEGKLAAYLSEQGIDGRQLERLLDALSRHNFKKQIASGTSVGAAFLELWSSDADLAKVIIRDVTQGVRDAQNFRGKWKLILESECRSHFYIYTRTPYVFANLEKDVRANLEFLTMLPGLSVSEKLESLKRLYLQDYTKFVTTLKFLIESSHFIDPAILRKSDTIGITPQEGVVNSWYNYNKYGSRSGRGSGSRG
jgi:hypothetical protein